MSTIHLPSPPFTASRSPCMSSVMDVSSLGSTSLQPSPSASSRSSKRTRVGVDTSSITGLPQPPSSMHDGPEAVAPHVNKKVKLEAVDPQLPAQETDGERDDEGTPTTATTNGEKNLQCTHPGCIKTFKTTGKLNRHLYSHSGERRFVCSHDGCGKAYFRKNHLQRHELTHIGERQFECTFEGCNLRFFTAQHLSRHLARHITSKLYPCTEESCTEVFRKKTQLRLHLCSEHGIGSNYTCPHADCCAGFMSKKALHHHVHSIHSVNSYICGECGEGFQTQKEMRVHAQQKHKNVFHCTECMRVFKRNHSLKQHMLTHDPNRTSFPCPYDGCGKVFVTEKGLNTHTRGRHEGIRPFKCPEPNCNSSFPTSSGLSTHRNRVHNCISPGRSTNSPTSTKGSWSARRMLIGRATSEPAEQGSLRSKKV